MPTAARIFRIQTRVPAYVLEAALLGAVAVAAFDFGVGAILPWLFAFAAPAAVIAVWGRFAAPESEHRLAGARLLIFKTSMFALGTGALAISTGPPAVAYAIAAILYLILALSLGIL